MKPAEDHPWRPGTRGDIDAKLRRIDEKAARLAVGDTRNEEAHAVKGYMRWRQKEKRARRFDKS